MSKSCEVFFVVALALSLSSAAGCGADRLPQVNAKADTGSQGSDGGQQRADSASGVDLGAIPDVGAPLGDGALSPRDGTFDSSSGRVDLQVAVDVGQPPADTSSGATAELRISFLGDGRGTVLAGAQRCTQSCTLIFPLGATIELRAEPAAEHVFEGWEGEDCTGTCTLELTATRALAVRFTAPRNRMFVTQETVAPGELGSLDDADKLCNEFAAKAKLPGHFVAWLSTKTVSAKTRLGAARGWLRVDGKPFADTIEHLLSALYHPPRIDEYGNDVGADSTAVATGTWINGASPPYATDTNCGGWADPNSTFSGGLPQAGHDNWTTYLSSISCAKPAHLYCFGVDYANPVPPPPGNGGRRAFVSDTAFVPQAKGIQAADDLCNKEAQEAGLPGTYRALLSSQSASAMSRFNLNGPPWVRTDGILIAPQPRDLFQAPLIDAAITANAHGAVHYGNYGVWTGGTLVDPAPAEATCNDWKGANDITDVVSGRGGRPAFTASQRFSLDTVACTASWIRITCLQQ